VEWKATKKIKDTKRETHVKFGAKYRAVAFMRLRETRRQTEK
jgi:hypothetical protein